MSRTGPASKNASGGLQRNTPNTNDEAQHAIRVYKMPSVLGQQQACTHTLHCCLSPFTLFFSVISCWASSFAKVAHLDTLISRFGALR